jgi:hypothetical protein
LPGPLTAARSPPKGLGTAAGLLRPGRTLAAIGPCPAGVAP